MKLNTIWRQLKARLVNTALGITGRNFRIVDIDPSEGELGYTGKGGEIHLARKHPIIDELGEDEQVMFVQGVFAHELMHQCDTSFVAYETALNTLPNHQKRIFQVIFNVMEDPAIEYWASSYFGGSLLRALHYTVKTLYKTSEKINPESAPFSQFIAACIHYGDGGIVKGHIADEMARKCFYDALPLLDECVTEPNGAKRVSLAKEVFRLTRPLWEEEAKNMEAMEKLMDELTEAMKEAGKDSANTGDGKGGPADKSGGGDKETAKKQKRRKITVKRISKEEAEAMGLDKGSDKGELPEGDITAYIVEGEESKAEDSGDTDSASLGMGDGKEGKPSDEKGEGKDSDGKSSDDPAENNSSEKDKESSSEEYNAHKGSPDDKPSEREYSTGEYEEVATEASDGVIDESEYELTAEDITSIKSEVEACLRGAQIEERSSDTVSPEELDVPSMKSSYPSSSCINLTVDSSGRNLESEYESLRMALSGGINNLTHQLKRVFQNDVESREYRQSGRINIGRLQSSRMTSRVFERKIAPNNKSDIAVMLVVDVSGSMRGQKELLAKQAAIGLAEVFHNLHIPYKVMTFSADSHVNGRPYDAIHTHYVNFRDSLAERVKLLHIAAGGNNFDGYSITYAANLMKKRKEQHKLMIVISDGQPACRSYDRAGGIADTKQAVKNAQKNANVIGVAIDADAEVIHSFYGQKFVEITKIEELFERLGAVIKKEIQKW